MAELRLRTLAAAGDVAAEHGARDVSGWLARAVRAEPARLRAEERLAGALERYAATGRAMASGAVNLEQARVIAAALDDLPDRLGTDVRERAERDLIALAADFGPADLRRLGAAILHTAAPDVADAEDARRLEEQERAAQERTCLRLRPGADGTTRVSLVLPDLDATRLATYLDAWTNPRLPASTDDAVPGRVDGADPDLARLPRHRRLGHAFCHLLERLDPAALPHQGGDATTVVVTVTLDALRTGLGRAEVLDPRSSDGTGDLSPSQVRRLACTAGIVPVVLGGAGEVLDVGRTRRLFTPVLRRALRLRDRVCRGEGCTVPARWCDAHHREAWSRGGGTRLDNGLLLCGHHHRRTHDPGYRHERLPDGDIRFHRRT